MTRKELRQANVALLLAVMVWGSSFVMVKDLLEHLSPAGVVGLRFGLACPLLLGVVLARGRAHTLKAAAAPGLWLGVWLAVVFLSQTVGMLFTRASNSAFITGMFVVFTPLWAWLVAGVRPKKADGLLALLAATGMALLSLTFTGPGRFTPNRGDLITLLTALAQALHIALTHRQVRRGLDPFALLFFQFAVVAAANLATAPFYPGGLGRLGELTPAHWWTIVYLAVFPACLTYLIQAVTQRFVEPMHLSLYFALEPVFASLFAVWFLLEGFTAQQLAGAGLLLGACLLSELARTPPEPVGQPGLPQGEGAVGDLRLEAGGE